MPLCKLVSMYKMQQESNLIIFSPYMRMKDSFGSRIIIENFSLSVIGIGEHQHQKRIKMCFVKPADMQYCKVIKIQVIEV